IAGFVNETEEEHKETLDLLDKAQFDFIYSYVYSPRSKTRAAKMEDTLPDDIKGARLREIQAYQLKIQDKIHQTMLGKTYRVLVDSDGNMGGIKKWKGRTNCNRIVHFRPETDEQDFKWHWVDVKITSATALSCQGELVQDLGKKAPSLLH
ncbi:MAG: hypothetical protein K2Q18_14705, partial [Bdellovibrionales bacterium]|nr:hypothetical protein [Bdellovibrionales bacterium]